jgi:hypothetical protein
MFQTQPGETMRTFNSKRLVCLSTVLALIGVSANAAACTNATLKGVYGYQEQGQYPGGGFSEFRSVGFFNFDGQGTGTRRANIWNSNFDVSFEDPFPVTYIVQSDCTFDLTYADNGETFRGVIVQGGQKLLYIETTGDPSRSGQAEKVQKK